MSIPKMIDTWQMIEQGIGGNPGKLVQTQIPVPEIKEEEALIKIAGCGVCHTDLGYFYNGVPTVNKVPITLGHEISGTIIAGPDSLIDKNVIIPAVMPCNDCKICKKGRGNRCLNQKMPGNSLGNFGGFSSHIPVSIEDLCFIDELKMPLSDYAVVADACTTPYQAAMRADLKKGDSVIIIGAAGGVGVYMTQIAKALGSDIIIGIDIVQEKLDQSLNFGADYIINSKNKTIKDIKKEYKNICKKAKISAKHSWKIFECSGANSGQDIALNLISFLGKLIVIGFNPNLNKFMLSKLMAFDAEIIGTWGCLPKYYKRVLSMVQKGDIKIQPFIESKPMSQIEKIFEQQHIGTFSHRQILIPDFK